MVSFGSAALSSDAMLYRSMVDMKVSWPRVLQLPHRVGIDARIEDQIGSYKCRRADEFIYEKALGTTSSARLASVISGTGYSLLCVASNGFAIPFAPLIGTSPP